MHNDGLKKFKNKILLETLLKSLIIGIVLGVITASVLAIIVKVKELDFRFLYCILIGIAITLITTPIIYIITKPNDLKVAKRVDESFSLNEKAQTMVAYKDNDDLIVQVQREDTTNKLNELDSKNMKMHFNLFYLIIVLLAVGTCITSTMIPTNANEIDSSSSDSSVIEDDYQVSEKILLKIDALIKYVNDADLTNELKKLYADELKSLKNNLIECKNEDLVQDIALDSINNISDILNKTNSNEIVYKALNNSTIEEIVALSLSVREMNSDKIKNEFAEIRKLLNVSTSKYEEVITNLKQNFGDLLEANGLKEETLSAAFIGLCNNLNDLLSNSPSPSKFDEVFNLYQPIVCSIIDVQYNNFVTESYVEDTLRNIFNLPKKTDEEDDNRFDPTSNSEDSDIEENVNGGAGNGDTIYGSNDLFYDYELGKVQYGEVIDSYYMEILAMFENGLISEDCRNYFIEYYDYLYGNADKGSGE